MRTTTTHDMGSRITEALRWAVIEKWMLGYPRNQIAIECGISNGAVSSIVDEWRRSTGLQLSTVIRDLGVTLRKLGMSPAQCATGLRVLRQIERIGLDENSIESFLLNVYTKCQALDINPNLIAKYIEGLVSLLEGRNNQQAVTSILGLEDIFEKRRQTNFELGEEKNRSESEINKLRAEASLCESALEELRQKKEILESDLRWKSDLRAELEKHELQVDDLPKLASAARLFKDRGFRVTEMLMMFSSYKGMCDAVARQQKQFEFLKQRCHDLEHMAKSEDELLQERRLKNKELDELKEMGFGLGELKVLRNLVTEAAIENGRTIQNGDAVRMLISDIENNLDDYLRLHQKVNQLKHEMSKLRSVMAFTPRLGMAIHSFLERQPSKEDIAAVISILKQYPNSRTPEAVSKIEEENSRSQSVLPSGSTDLTQSAEGDDAVKSGVDLRNKISNYSELQEQRPNHSSINNTVTFNALGNSKEPSSCGYRTYLKSENCDKNVGENTIRSGSPVKPEPNRRTNVVVLPIEPPSILSLPLKLLYSTTIQKGENDYSESITVEERPTSLSKLFSMSTMHQTPDLESLLSAQRDDIMRSILKKT